MKAIKTNRVALTMSLMKLIKKITKLIVLWMTCVKDNQADLKVGNRMMIIKKMAMEKNTHHYHYTRDKIENAVEYNTIATHCNGLC